MLPTEIHRSCEIFNLIYYYKYYLKVFEVVNQRT